MKKVFLLLIVFSLFSFNILSKEREVDISKEQFRNGLVYIVNEQIPFTGRITMYSENGQLILSRPYKNGKEDGTWYGYDGKTGAKDHEEVWKDGKPIKITTWWYTGSLEYVTTFNNQDNTYKCLSYDRNGNYKDSWTVYFSVPRTYPYYIKDGDLISRD